MSLYSLDLNTDLPTGPTSLSENFVNKVPGNVLRHFGSDYFLLLANDSFFVYPQEGFDSVKALASYNACSKSWTSVPVSGDSIASQKCRNCSSPVSDPFSGLSFYAENTANVPAMLFFNTSTSESPTVYRRDFKGEVPPETSFGNMVYLPLGRAGVLLQIGGELEKERFFRPMDQASIFDIDTVTW